MSIAYLVVLIADRFIGYDKPFWLCNVIMHWIHIINLCVDHNIFILGLAIVTVGSTGTLKPNISSMLSMIYQKLLKAK